MALITATTTIITTVFTFLIVTITKHNVGVPQVLPII